MQKRLVFNVLLCFLVLSGMTQEVLPGAERLSQYLPLLSGKKVAVFANQTSRVGNKHLVDVLIENKVSVGVIFGPEHGFRGEAGAGEKVGNYIDQQTGIKVVSLYGQKTKPSAEDLSGIDVMLFDIQDVGVRFYTFISSLEGYMEAAFLNNKRLIVLDRPNPNIHYVDGPVLETKFRSFVGMQPVPVVYGMSIGEYAKMLVGEKWLSPLANQSYTQNLKLDPSAFVVVPCGNYNRQMIYTLPVKPSPNLPNNAAIYWYPSICFFEGTVLSEGRGTKTPFMVFGHPTLPDHLYSFKPTAMPGAMQPKLKDQVCYGWNLNSSDQIAYEKVNGRLHIEYLVEAYRLFPEKEKFFILPKSGDAEASFFNKLAGNSTLMNQLKKGLSAEEIRSSWKPGIDSFMFIRNKYLLY
jgi:uncharacterized protein YbbC (DUF1343 family)